MKIEEFKSPMQTWDWYAQLANPLAAALDPYGDFAKNALLDITTKIDILRQWTPRLEDEVLDFGCGLGRISEWLAPGVDSILAIDTSPLMIQRARALQTAQNVRYELTSLDNIHQTFDVILAVGVVKFITDPEVLKEVGQLFERLLKPGGRVIISNL